MKRHDLSGDVQLRVERDLFGAQMINAYRKWNGKYTQPIHWDVVGAVSLYDFKNGNVEVYINNKRATKKDLIYVNK